MTGDPEQHRQRHLELHKALDELLADYLNHGGLVPSQATVLELLDWSAEQTRKPTPTADTSPPVILAVAQQARRGDLVERLQRRHVSLARLFQGARESERQAWRCFEKLEAQLDRLRACVRGLEEVKHRTCSCPERVTAVLAEYCTGCLSHVSECGPELWAQQKKCCPDCSHEPQPDAEGRDLEWLLKQSSEKP